jgi:hypothetical protein
LLWNSKWPRAVTVAAIAAVFGGAWSLIFLRSLRELYPLLPFTVLIAGIASAAARIHSNSLSSAFGAVSVFALAAQLAILPAASPEHSGFAWLPFAGSGAREEYLQRYAPERILLGRVPDPSPRARAAVLWGNGIGGYAGPIASTSWQCPTFRRLVLQAESADAISIRMRNNGYRWFVAPAASTGKAMDAPYLREFLERHTLLKSSSGGMELRQLRRETLGFPREMLPYAGPGFHSEDSPSLVLNDSWSRAGDADAIRTNRRRASAQFRFNGSAVNVIYTSSWRRCPDVVVRIDAGEPVTFSQRMDTAMPGALSPRFDAAGAGRHILDLRLRPDDLAASQMRNCTLEIDGFLVHP